MKKQKHIIGIIGQTASGKTKLAVELAYLLNGEIISADSRQVYKHMDIGTGKDLNEYYINNKPVPYHLIDICNPGEEYNVFRFQQDFLQVYNNITAREKQPIMCGGSVMYIDAVVSGYAFQPVPENTELRKKWQKLPDNELTEQLKKLKPLHNSTDITDRKRLERALEIAIYEQNNPQPKFPALPFVLYMPVYERSELKKRITERLKQRLQNGMIEEVENLIKHHHITIEKLKYYGLEYKIVAQYLAGELNYNDMFQKLNSAIAQFAKRQLTFYRKMQKKGVTIHTLDGNLPFNKKTDIILSEISKLNN
jgi:tRNA dimethylallyltransferase